MTMSSNSTLSGQSMKSSPDVGMSLASTMGQNGHEMPPKPLSDLWPKGEIVKQRMLLTTQFYEDKVISIAGTYQQCALKKTQDGNLDKALCALEENQPLRKLKIPWGKKNEWTQILAPSHTQKSTNIINRNTCSLWLAVTFIEMCLTARIPWLKSYIYIYTGHFPCLLGAVPQSCLRGCLLRYSPQ